MSNIGAGGTIYYNTLSLLAFSEIQAVAATIAGIDRPAARRSGRVAKIAKSGALTQW